MIPGKANTAGVDAMSDDILWKWIGRIASPLVASQVALSRAFDQLLPRSFRVDGSKDFKQCIVPRYLRPGRIHAPANYAHLQFGPYKGNPSRDGDRLVVLATNDAGALVAFAYDLSERKKYPDINLGNIPGSSVLAARYRTIRLVDPPGGAFGRRPASTTGGAFRPRSRSYSSLTRRGASNQSR